VQTTLRVDPAGQRPCGRPKKRLLDRLNEDMRTMNVTPEDAQDRARWRKAIQQADPAPTRDQR